MEKEIVITNVHERGFAFGALTDTGEHVFLPPFVCNQLSSIAVGSYLLGTLVKNSDKYDTPYQCIKARGVCGIAAPIVEIEQDDDTLEDEIIEIIELAGAPVTTAYIADRLGFEDTKQVTKLLNDLWAEQKLVRGDVFSKPEQARTSLTMWAGTLANFKSICAPICAT